jgi:hypothetical protein
MAAAVLRMRQNFAPALTPSQCSGAVAEVPYCRAVAAAGVAVQASFTALEGIIGVFSGQNLRACIL